MIFAKITGNHDVFGKFLTGHFEKVTRTVGRLKWRENSKLAAPSSYTKTGSTSPYLGVGSNLLDTLSLEVTEELFTLVILTLPVLYGGAT